MTKLMKIAAVAAAALVTVPAVAAPVGVTGAPPTARARIIKPLSLTATGALDFGTIVIPAGGVTANRVIALSSANVMDCAGGAAEVTCSGATSVPTYNVQGTQGQRVTIIKTASNLTNSVDGSTLSMTPTGPADLVLTNSGAPGFNFEIGGSITITPTTTDGVYSGSVDVTVDYQ